MRIVVVTFVVIPPARANTASRAVIVTASPPVSSNTETVTLPVMLPPAPGAKLCNCS